MQRKNPSQASLPNASIDLTSLLDVIFIFLFVVIISNALATQRARADADQEALRAEQYEAENARVEQENRELAQANDELREENQGLTQTNQDLRAAQQELEQDREGLEQAYRELEQRQQGLEDEKTSLEQQCSQIKDQYFEVSAALEANRDLEASLGEEFLGKKVKLIVISCPYDTYDPSHRKLIAQTQDGTIIDEREINSSNDKVGFTQFRNIVLAYLDGEVRTTKSDTTVFVITVNAGSGQIQRRDKENIDILVAELEDTYDNVY